MQDFASVPEERTRARDILTNKHFMMKLRVLSEKSIF